MKEYIRPALAIIWSLGAILTWAGTGYAPPWMITTAITCVVWFFRARDIEKKSG